MPHKAAQMLPEPPVPDDVATVLNEVRQRLESSLAALRDVQAPGPLTREQYDALYAAAGKQGGTLGVDAWDAGRHLVEVELLLPLIGWAKGGRLEVDTKWVAIGIFLLADAVSRPSAPSE